MVWINQLLSLIQGQKKKENYISLDGTLITIVIFALSI